MPERQRAVVARHEDAAPADAARAKALVAVLRTAEPDSREMYEAFYELDSLPTDVVRAELAEWMGPLPDVDQLDAATRRALRLPPPALRLSTMSLANDADIFDLGSIAEEQVRLAGRTWDGLDMAAEERLDGELEGSFAGTLQRVVLADADATPTAPLFDVVLFAEDAGVVFAAGTTALLALIAYGKVEMRDQRTRVAIESALAARGSTPAPVEHAALAGVATDAAPTSEPVAKPKKVAKTASRPARDASTKKTATKKRAATKTTRRA